MSKTARVLFVTVYLLVGLGVVMTYSASAVVADRVYENAQFLLSRQIMFTLLGTILLFGAASMSVNFWKKIARPGILISIALLVAVFIPVLGHWAGGARRWIDLGPVNFQPSELVKLMVCVYLADYLSRKMKDIRKGGVRIFLPPLLLIGISCCLILLQPDLGSTAFICLMTAVLFFMAGIRMRYVLSAGAVFLPIFYFLVIRVPYRLSRVTAYLNPWEDPKGSGFQIIQSFLAFGLGGIHGVGLGQSTQKLFYLPSSHNDFIFSVMGEELGLIGVLGVWALYFTIFVCGIIMARRARGDFERMLIIALTLLIVFQALVNMMVATGLVPTKGLPLPFISYGGTSLVMNLLGVGLLISLDGATRRR